MSTSGLRRVLLAVTVSAALVVAGCSSSTGTGGSSANTSGPLKIGMSLPQSGAVADVAKSGYQGYQEWAAEVNATGGLLGRQVQLNVLDDGFDQNAVVANYNRLISQDKVDLLLGTFSSKLNAAASAVAERQKKLYIEPSGGDASLFNRGFTRLFFAQPATTAALPDRFVEWVASLPPGQRPLTAAYVTQDDPSASPAVNGFRQKLEGLGIRTVYNQVYAPGNKTFDPIASAIANAAPDVLIQGAVTDDGVQLVRSLQKLSYSPKILFQTQAPSDPAYPQAIGPQNVQGIFTAVGWSSKAPYPGNAQFVDSYTKRFGEPPSEDAANSYTAGQVLAAAVKAVGSLDQDALAKWLHANTVQTIVGPLKWDKTGIPEGTLLLAQWQDGVLETVSPQSAATSTKVVNPKPGWRS
jgi:branched-chain amino acid transport system substrate-binding protein